MLPAYRAKLRIQILDNWVAIHPFFQWICPDIISELTYVGTVALTRDDG